jgi:hypothetical protein
VRWYDGCSVGGELLLLMLLSSDQKAACLDHVEVTNMGELSMGGYLPHQIVCGFTLHTVLSRWYTTLDTKEPSSAARGVVADARLA